MVRRKILFRFFLLSYEWVIHETERESVFKTNCCELHCATWDVIKHKFVFLILPEICVTKSCYL